MSYQHLWVGRYTRCKPPWRVVVKARGWGGNKNVIFCVQMFNPVVVLHSAKIPQTYSQKKYVSTFNPRVVFASENMFESFKYLPYLAKKLHNIICIWCIYIHRIYMYICICTYLCTCHAFLAQSFSKKASIPWDPWMYSIFTFHPCSHENPTISGSA